MFPALESLLRANCRPARILTSLLLGVGDCGKWRPSFDELKERFIAKCFYAHVSSYQGEIMSIIYLYHNRFYNMGLKLYLSRSIASSHRNICDAGFGLKEVTSIMQMPVCMKLLCL